MIKNYLIFALRRLGRNKLTTIINIVGINNSKLSRADVLIDGLNILYLVFIRVSRHSSPFQVP